jgi:hypothetical protein
MSLLRGAIASPPVVMAGIVIGRRGRICDVTGRRGGLIL